jgi:hypothetical protein
MQVIANQNNLFILIILPTSVLFLLELDTHPFFNIMPKKVPIPQAIELANSNIGKRAFKPANPTKSILPPM